MKPIQNSKWRSSGAWTPKGKVWFQKNDDSKLVNTEAELRHGCVKGCSDCKRLGYICRRHALEAEEYQRGE